MTAGEILGLLYNTGILAFAIVLLALAIIIYPTLKKSSRRGRK